MIAVDDVVEEEAAVETGGGLCGTAEACLDLLLDLCIFLLAAEIIDDTISLAETSLFGESFSPARCANQ